MLLENINENYFGVKDSRKWCNWQKCQMSIILTKTLMKITLDVCIQIVLKYISTFHTNHKQNLNDTCLNYDSYEIKLLENINDDIIDKNVNDIWFLKEKKDNIDKKLRQITLERNILKNYIGKENNIIDKNYRS